MEGDAIDRDYFERRFVPAFAPLAAYHRFELRGVEHLPSHGPAVLALTHSAATYEAFLAVRAVYLATGRIVRGLGHRFWFRVPLLRRPMERMGFILAEPEGARGLLERGELIGVAPGGIREAIRPTSERFSVRWSARDGFLKLALATGAPIVLGACPSADLIYHVYPSRLTEWGYRRWKLPLFVIRGLGPTLLPRPVRLRYHVAPPIEVARRESPTENEVEALRARVLGRMEQLLDEAVRADGLDGG